MLVKVVSIMLVISKAFVKRIFSVIGVICLLTVLIFFVANVSIVVALAVIFTHITGGGPLNPQGSPLKPPICFKS